MSIVQPENGLPERRVITADSFHALKLKLSGARHSSEPVPEKVPAVSSAVPVGESIQALSALSEKSGMAEIIRATGAPHPEPNMIAETPFLEIVPAAAEIAIVMPGEAEPASFGAQPDRTFAIWPGDGAFVERRVLEKARPEDAEAGQQAHALLEIMVMPTSGSQERALANDTLLRLIPRMPLKSLRRLADRVCMMEAPSQMLVRRLINDPRIEVSGPLLENAMSVHDSDLIAVANVKNPPSLKLIARRRRISPALSEALIQSNHVQTLLNLVRNQGASFSIESMWRLSHFAVDHPVLQAPLVTRQDTPSPIAFQLFWRLPSELRRYVLSRFLTDSETVTRILTMNMEAEGTDEKCADLSLLSKLVDAPPGEAGQIFSKLIHVSEATGARIANDAGGEALTVALKAAGLTRAQFAGIIDKRPDAAALKSIFETLSFTKARVLLTYWDWAVMGTGPYARTVVA